MWKKKENKFLWSKESDKRNALYTNLCTMRQRDQAIDVQTKSDSVSRVFSRRGDAELKESRWSNALSFFSRSLCFAETNEQMSHGFANRAICFYEMKMFNECLVDMDLAKEYKYANLDELEKRQIDCVHFLEIGNQTESFVPQLSFEQHEHFPGLANILQISRNKEDGLHVRATVDIEAGKTVLVERAFTALSIGNEQRCSKCFATYTNLVPCKQCTRALFCVDSCEDCDIHRLECGIQLPKIISLIKEDFYPVIRSIVVAINIFQNVDDLKDFVENVIREDQMKLPTDSIDNRSKYGIFLRHFDKNHPNSSNTTKSNIQSIYQALMSHQKIAKQFSTKHHQRFLMHLIGHHISIRRNIANGIEFRNKLVTPVIGSYFNHACSPNAIMLPIDGRVVVSTCRPIKSGEQICISYHGTKFQSPFIERQKIIESEFHFKCKCDRCTMEVTETLPSRKFLNDEQRNLLKNSAETLLYTMEKRKSVTELCIKLLNEHGRGTWCEDLGMVLSNYFVLLHTKFLMKTHY